MLHKINNRICVHYDYCNYRQVQIFVTYPTVLTIRNAQAIRSDSVSDPYSSNPDPDPAKNLNPDPDPGRP